jgi:Flp pilus assembly protein TadD
MQRGDAAELPSPPPATGGWALGPPDVVIQLPAYTLRADGADVFRNFVVAMPPRRERFVRGWQFRPGTRAVHHANIRLDPTPASRRLDDADPLPGYEGIILRSADFPAGHFLGWTPGQTLIRTENEMAWTVASPSDFVVQLHMRPTGRAERVAPVIGLYLTDRAPSDRAVMLRLGRQRLTIPAGAATYTVEDHFVLPVDAAAHAVLAHAHYRARRLRAWATLPDRTERGLLRIDDWDPAWQERYPYRSPIPLPAGATIHLEYTFDNSAANPRNPESPPRLAEWGWRTTDEMGDVWLQLTTRSSDREALEMAARLKMQTEDAIGCETLIAREPRRVDLRNDAGAIYLAIDRPADALRHFGEVTRVAPALAQGWFNAGVAHEALGEAEAAERHYARAVALAPEYSVALNNLASLWIRRGRGTEARPLLERAVREDPDNVEARANLALVLIADRVPGEAVPHLSAALAARPDRAGGLVQFVWLLAAAADDTARLAADAARLAAAIVQATGRRDPRALDALGIAHAAGGRFEAAVTAATDALALEPPAPLASGIRARLALYQKKQPFVLPR